MHEHEWCVALKKRQVEWRKTVGSKIEKKHLNNWRFAVLERGAKRAPWRHFAGVVNEIKVVVMVGGDPMRRGAKEKWKKVDRNRV